MCVEVKAEDHPRLCGEKFLLFSFEQFRIGSPPPMRGKVSKKCYISIITKDHPRLCGEKIDQTYSGTEQVEITPAYAGKRSPVGMLPVLPEDHPRLCGEKCIEFAGVANTPGSPPPMRGKEDCKQRQQRCKGITPAYAGKSHGSGDGDEGR